MVVDNVLEKLPKSILDKSARKKDSLDMLTFKNSYDSFPIVSDVYQVGIKIVIISPFTLVNYICYSNA